ncbi:MAG: DUF378 domain-containing protein [Legionella sp.]|nr:DUF378 domain-containing protein [Legionella sp.]
MFRLNYLDLLMLVLLVIGGLNWGLVGLLNFDLVAYLFGAMTHLSRIVYALVGIAALYTIYLLLKHRGVIGR